MKRRKDTKPAARPVLTVDLEVIEDPPTLDGFFDTLFTLATRAAAAQAAPSAIAA